MPRKPKDLEPEAPEPNATPGESLPAMEDTVRKLSGIFTENIKIPEGPASEENLEEIYDAIQNHTDDEDEDDE